MKQTDEISPSFSVRLSVFFGAVFLIVGTFLPFFPVWLDWKSLPAEQIGIILAAPLIVRVAFTPVISFIADKIGDHRLILIILAWGTLASFCGLLLCEGFLQIFFLSIFLAMFWTTIMPLTDTVAMAGVRRAGLDYGQMRIWGSITFILASLGGGFVVGAYGEPSALWLLIVAAIVVVFSAHFLPRPQGLGRLKAATVAPNIKLSDAVMLARAPLFLLFLLTTSLIQASHAVFYGFGTLHWQSLGISSLTSGMLWAVGVLAEIVLFYYSRSLFSHVGAGWLLVLAALAGVVRWGLTAFDPPLALLFPCQILHALTFGAAHLASVHFISESVPEGHTGTALGLYAAITAGVAMGLAMVSAGWLYEQFAGLAYLAMAGLCALGLVGAVLLLKSWHGQALVAEGDH